MLLSVFCKGFRGGMYHKVEDCFTVSKQIFGEISAEPGYSIASGIYCTVSHPNAAGVPPFWKIYEEKALHPE